MARSPKPVVHKAFTGKNNVDPAERLSPRELREAQNVDIDRTGRISRRKGFSQVLAGAGVHSLWAEGATALFVAGSDLKQLAADYTATTLRSGLQAGRRMSYAKANEGIYYSDGMVTGVVRNGADAPWGLPTPPAQPTLSAGVGALPAGTYQVAITFADADGRESGAGKAAVVTLASTGGIQLTGIPSSALASAVRIYATPVNGDQLYLAASVANGTTSHLLTGGTWTQALRSQFVDPAPAGQLVEYFKGRMLVAVGPLLFYSDPYALEWFRLAHSFIPFPADITLVGAVEDGLFVSADQTYFLRGVTPGEQVLELKSNAKAVLGSMARTDRANTGRKEVAGEVLMWMSDQGVMFGSAGGALENVTSRKLSFSIGDQGAGLVRHANGISQYVGITKNPSGDGSNAYTGDVAAARVVRNGITVS